MPSNQLKDSAFFIWIKALADDSNLKLVFLAGRDKLRFSAGEHDRMTRLLQKYPAGVHRHGVRTCTEN
jgi:hypothetical protein